MVMASGALVDVSWAELCVCVWGCVCEGVCVWGCVCVSVHVEEEGRSKESPDL